MSEQTAVTVAPKAAVVDPRVREAKERNAIVTAIRGQMWSKAVSYTHLTLPTTLHECRSRWSPYH